MLQKGMLETWIQPSNHGHHGHHGHLHQDAIVSALILSSTICSTKTKAISQDLLFLDRSKSDPEKPVLQLNLKRQIP